MTFIKNLSELNTQKVVCEGSLVSASLMDNRIDDKWMKSKFTHLSRVLKQFLLQYCFVCFSMLLTKNNLDANKTVELNIVIAKKITNILNFLIGDRFVIRRTRYFISRCDFM